MNQLVIYDAANQRWLQFQEPCEIIAVYSLDQVLPGFQQVNQKIKQHQLYGAGFISYEAASAFDSVLTTYDSTVLPLLWFGLYHQPEILELPQPIQVQHHLLNWVPSVTHEEYNQAIATIKQYIAEGDTYQVNYTFRLHAAFQGDYWQLFLQLVQAQQAHYAAYIETEDFAICSASPELFFRLDGDELITRPMKGTAPRGYTLSQDQQLAKELHHCPKNRAENVMIVDMIRNDLGRVADLGTIQVPSLFEVEKYPTLWQMTSTVTAKTLGSITDIMTALFPCASITGAPKRRTMEIIQELETTPRQIYTGNIGFITPDNQAQFNVAIRTVFIDKKTNQAEYGVGSGIVWDSDSQNEYIECQTKAQVLTRFQNPFSLLETMLWKPNEGYFLLEYHLERLQQSALYFDFKIHCQELAEKLNHLANSLPQKTHKIRILVQQNGNIQHEIMALPVENNPQPVQLRLSRQPISSDNPFLYHKTTNRQIYQQAKATHSDCDDVILWNERGEITETCIYNLIIQLNGELLTPAINCGLLAGTFRQLLIDQKQIQAAIIPVESLEKCEAIYVINSVQKWREAVLLN